MKNLWLHRIVTVIFSSSDLTRPHLPYSVFSGRASISELEPNLCFFCSRDDLRRTEESQNVKFRLRRMQKKISKSRHPGPHDSVFALHISFKYTQKSRL